MGAPPAGGPEVVCLGAATVDRTYAVSNLPERDGGAYADDVAEFPGGVGANVAHALAHFGRDAGLIARLGEDDLGDRVAADLAGGPVDDERVRRGPGTSTHCVVLRGPSGDRMIVTAGDSTVRLRLDEDDLGYCRGADAVFLTAYVPDAVTRAVVDAAADPDFPPVAFDLSGPVPELRDRGTEPETIEAVCEIAALFVANEVAAESFLGVPAADAADELRRLGVTRAAVTAGEVGATLVDGDVTRDVPAFDVDVVDATGAGDAFNAALVDRWLLAGEDPAVAGRFAAATAALNCTGSGARGGLPTTDAVRSFLAARR